MQRFQESLATLLKNQEGEVDHYFGGYMHAMKERLWLIIQAYHSVS